MSTTRSRWTTRARWPGRPWSRWGRDHVAGAGVPGAQQERRPVHHHPGPVLRLPRTVPAGARLHAVRPGPARAPLRRRSGGGRGAPCRARERAEDHPAPPAVRRGRRRAGRGRRPAVRPAARPARRGGWKVTVQRDPISADLLIRALRRGGDRPALTAGGRTWSAAAVAEEISRYAQAYDAWGIGPGSPTAILAANRAEVLFQMGTNMVTGARTTALHPMGSLADQADILRDAGVR